MGCPFKCVFCDQKKISSAINTDVIKIIDSYLETIETKHVEKKVEVAFYGGSFTAVEKERQVELLALVQPYLMSGRVDNIRVSTRPDFVSVEILEYLKVYGVSVIELGVQSLDEKVLGLSGRGHDPSCVHKSSSLIKDANIKLGIQLMPGLPGDTLDSILETMEKTISIGPDFVRIYPTVVIQDTLLHEQLIKKKYFPMILSDAVQVCAKMYREFTNNHIKVIRMGLQATDLLDKEYVIDGPYHPSFGELVLNQVAFELLIKQINVITETADYLIFRVPLKQLSIYLGQKRTNVRKLKSILSMEVKIIGCNDLPLNQFEVATPGKVITCFQNYIR